MFTLLPVTLDICIVYNSDIVWSQQATTSFKHLADVKLNQNKCHFFHPQSETPLLLRFLRSDRLKTGSPSHRCRGWGQPRDSDALLLLLPFLGRRGWETLWVFIPRLIWMSVPALIILPRCHSHPAAMFGLMSHCQAQRSRYQIQSQCIQIVCRASWPAVFPSFKLRHTVRK